MDLVRLFTLCLMGLTFFPVALASSLPASVVFAQSGPPGQPVPSPPPARSLNGNRLSDSA